MAKKVEVLSCWDEKAPTFLVVPVIKTSLSPELETISEEDEVEEIVEKEGSYYSLSLSHSRQIFVYSSS